MVYIEIELENYTTEEKLKITLPDDMNKYTSDLGVYRYDWLVVDWDTSIKLGAHIYDDVVALNNSLEKINSEIPEMTLKILEKIYISSNASSLKDDKFIEKICNNDYMYEEIPEDYCPNLGSNERCACFLLKQLKIPFAKNITEKDIAKMRKKRAKINWFQVWKFYETMGFLFFESDNNQPVIFHWGDAEKL